MPDAVSRKVGGGSSDGSAVFNDRSDRFLTSFPPGLGLTEGDTGMESCLGGVELLTEPSSRFIEKIEDKRFAMVVWLGQFAASFSYFFNYVPKPDYTLRFLQAVIMFFDKIREFLKGRNITG